MTPYHHDDWMTVWQGDCREVMRQMEPESVHCVVTSPPYWGLRDYGTATWVGGDEGCDHKDAPTHKNIGFNERWGRPTGELQQEQSQERNFRDTCRKCGATRVDSQLGLEATPEEFVANMVDVFREVKRVLRKDGTCWVNLGDSYSQGGYAGDDAPSNARRIANGGRDGVFSGAGKEAIRQGHRKPMQRSAAAIGLKPKDLVGIPWRVAFALQADGWYLRSDIIWAKPNPMPESVTDRPTKSHEYLFLLTKSARYYYDADAVREKHRWQDAELLATNAQARQGQRLAERRAMGDGSAVRTQPPLGREKGRGKNGNAESEFSADPAGRNLRTVWTIATQPYPGAHFATFPPKLVEPCIKAGAPEKVCGECGAGWRRVTETTKYEPRVVEVGVRNVDASRGDKTRKLSGADYNEQVQRRTLGFIPSCKHDAETVPATVLDPFAGSGTVGMVAQSLSRRAVLIDLNGDYLVQAMSRNQQSPLGLETA